MRGGESDQGRAGDQPSRLAELLECEHELAELLAVAREEGRRRVTKAREEVGRAEAELEVQLGKATERVRREVRDEAQARVHDVLARARADVARFEGIEDEEVRRLAESAFRSLLRGELAP